MRKSKTQAPPADAGETEAQRMARERFEESDRRLRDAWKENDRLFKKMQGGKGSKITVQAWNQSLADIDRRQKTMFQNFDAWQRTLRMVILVAEVEIRQIVHDSIMDHADGLGIDAQTGLERHRTAFWIADEFIAVLKQDRVRVEESEQEVPYCEECE